MSLTELSPAESRALAGAVREEMARRRLSRQGLADLARISLSTLEKALSGSRPFTLATVVRLESALGMRLRGEEPASGAPQIDLGGYVRAAAQMLEGDYLTLRPSFENPAAVFAYRTEIAWSAAQACLVFQESGRLDAGFSQTGLVAAPLSSGHIYLHTNVGGQMRLAILSRPLHSGEMFGLLATLIAGAGSQLTPAACPLALVPAAPEDRLGQIAPAEPDFDRYRRLLDRAASGGFTRLLG